MVVLASTVVPGLWAEDPSASISGSLQTVGRVGVEMDDSRQLA
jgi:hypothetical protein